MSTGDFNDVFGSRRGPAPQPVAPSQKLDDPEQKLITVARSPDGAWGWALHDWQGQVFERSGPFETRDEAMADARRAGEAAGVFGVVERIA